MKPDSQAIVVITGGDEIQVRPATFVFMTPDGFAWIEPAYREPASPRNNFHRFAGTITATSSGFSCAAADGRTFYVEPMATVEPGLIDGTIAAMEWARADIEAETSMREERQRLQELLAHELA